MINEKEIINSGYVVMCDTLCNGPVILHKESEENDNTMHPQFYESEEAAWKDIADDMITGLQQFIDGEKEFDETDFETENYVAYAVEYEDGNIDIYDSKVETGSIKLLTTSLKEINS